MNNEETKLFNQSENKDNTKTAETNPTKKVEISEKAIYAAGGFAADHLQYGEAGDV